MSSKTKTAASRPTDSAADKTAASRDSAKSLLLADKAAAAASRPTDSAKSLLFAGGLLTRDKSATLMGVEAAQRVALTLKASSTEVNFGAVKRGYRYSCTLSLTNASCSGIRWRITSRTPRQKATGMQTLVMLDAYKGFAKPPRDVKGDRIQCRTPRERIAPGVTKTLIFELRADHLGAIQVAFQVYGREDALRSSATTHAHEAEDPPRLCALHIQATANVLSARDFRAHVCQSRFERRALLAKNVACLGALPVPRDEQAVDISDDLSNSTLAEEQEGKDSKSIKEPEEEEEEEEAASVALEKRSEDLWGTAEKQLPGCFVSPEALLMLETDPELEELKMLPHFPGCVYDPRTRKLKLDLQQRAAPIETALSLTVIREREAAKRALRCKSLEGGGLLTGRALTALQKRFTSSSSTIMPPTEEEQEQEEEGHLS